MLGPLPLLPPLPRLHARPLAPTRVACAFAVAGPSCAAALGRARCWTALPRWAYAASAPTDLGRAHLLSRALPRWAAAALGRAEPVGPRYAFVFFNFQ